MMSEPGIFEPLPLRHRMVVPISAEEYSIYSRTGEVKEVKANTAYEAFKLSGFSEAIRIERKAAIKHSVLTKARFIDEAKPVDMDDQSDFSLMHRRKSPVVSADDLDTLMRALQVAEQTPMPPEEQDQIPQIITSPTGVEVHGDGFDELIPANVAPMQMSGIRSASDTVSIDEPPAEEPAAEPVETTPQQELTQDEITKLLNG